MICPCNGCGGYDKWKEDNKQKFELWLENREHPKDISALDSEMEPTQSVKPLVMQKMKELSSAS